MLQETESSSARTAAVNRWDRYKNLPTSSGILLEADGKGGRKLPEQPTRLNLRKGRMKRKNQKAYEPDR